MTATKALRRFANAGALARGVVSSLGAAILAWQQRARDARAMRSLDDRALKDIGLSRADVEREAARLSGWSAWR